MVMKCKKYLVCCHSKVEKHDGKEYSLPSASYFFPYWSYDFNNSISELVDLVSNLGYLYFDVIYISDGKPFKVHSSVTDILPF